MLDFQLTPQFEEDSDTILALVSNSHSNENNVRKVKDQD